MNKPTFKRVLILIAICTLIPLFTFVFFVFYCCVHFDGQRETSEIAAIFDMKAIKIALANHKIQLGFYPDTKAGIETLVNTKMIHEDKTLSYLPKLPFDPWGNLYVYHYPAIYSKNQPWDLYSIGPDGVDDRKSGDDIDSTPELEELK